jgi:hypothetical protein
VVGCGGGSTTSNSVVPGTGGTSGARLDSAVAAPVGSDGSTDAIADGPMTMSSGGMGGLPGTAGTGGSSGSSGGGASGSGGGAGGSGGASGGTTGSGGAIGMGGMGGGEAAIDASEALMDASAPPDAAQPVDEQVAIAPDADLPEPDAPLVHGPDATAGQPDSATLDAAPALDASSADLSPDSQAQDPNSWTIMVYGHGDHSLSASLLTDMQEMAAANLGTQVRVLVLADWDARRTIPGDTKKFPSGYFLYLLDGNQQNPTLVDSGPELNLDDPAALSATTSFVVKNYPAARYGVVLWDHGGAWKGGFGGDTQDGTAVGSPMSAEAVAGAIRQGLAAAGVGGERPLEFVAFDTCLMAGVETAAPFANLAKAFIGDAEIDYGDGWDYTASLTWLAANPSSTAQGFASQEVAVWDAHHATKGPNDRLLRSHVALDLTKFVGFSTTAKAFADAVKNGQAASFSRAAFASVPAYEQNIQSPAPTAIRDVGQLLRGVTTGPLAATSTAMIQSLEGMRLGISRGSYRAGQDGLHGQVAPALVLNPAELALYSTRAKTWNDSSSWGGMLDVVRAAADSTAPTLVNPVVTVPPSPGPGNYPHVDFTLQAPDVMFTEGTLVQYHPTVPDVAVLLGYLAAAYVNPGDYRFSWPGRQWVIPTTTGSIPLTLSPWVVASTSNGLEIPLFEVKGVLSFSWGEKVPCSLLVDATTLVATAVVVGEGTVASVRPLAFIRSLDPGLVAFFPRISMLDLVTGQPLEVESSNGVYLPASGTIQIGSVAALAGEYALLLGTYDHWSNVGYEAFPITLTAPIP